MKNNHRTINDHSASWFSHDVLTNKKPMTTKKLIGLIDADLMWQKRSVGRRYGKTKNNIFPNIALMKLSAWHKQQGDQVEWYFNLKHYDRVYISKIFSTTPEATEVINADEVIRGGSGYAIQLVDGREQWQAERDSELPYEIEHIMPDYSLYPMVEDTAYGFLSRGCPRGCSFCHVVAKEGSKAYKVANLSEWWKGQKNIVLCDPNILACREWRDLLTQLAESKARVNINQGLDARLLTPEKVSLLNHINLSTIHFAWDDYSQRDTVLRGLCCFKDYFKRQLDKGHFAQVFVLTNFDTTPEQDLERIYTLRDMGFEPYVMVYDKTHAAPFYKSLQRWVNHRAIFHKVKTFEEYNKNYSKNENHPRVTYREKKAIQ